MYVGNIREPSAHPPQESTKTACSVVFKRKKKRLFSSIHSISFHYIRNYLQRFNMHICTYIYIYIIYISEERVWSPQCFCWLECAQCVYSWTRTLLGGLWDVHNFCDTCTSSVKRAQLLENVHNISDTCTTSLKRAQIEYVMTLGGAVKHVIPIYIYIIFYTHTCIYVCACADSYWPGTSDTRFFLRIIAGLSYCDNMLTRQP